MTGDCEIDRTNILRKTEILRWSSQIFDTSSNQTPLHERSPKEHGFWPYSNEIQRVDRSRVVKNVPAGWRMKLASLEAEALDILRKDQVPRTVISWVSRW
jgi:hypothetical protein